MHFRKFLLPAHAVDISEHQLLKSMPSLLKPPQPNPAADTSSPVRPNLIFSMLNHSLLFLFDSFRFPLRHTWRNPRY
jgi:hypothetical protein